MNASAGGFRYDRGAIVRGDTTKKELAIVFTGHEFAEGGNRILQTLKQQNIKASFFFTGDFYRNKKFQSLIKHLNDYADVGIHPSFGSNNSIFINS